MIVIHGYTGRICTSVPKSSPFGAKASVFNWESDGQCIRNGARRLLHIVVFEYVDDYFAAEHPDVVQHALHGFAKVVGALFVG